MKEEFLRKLRSKQYISNLLYQNILKMHSNVIPDKFDIDLYNNKVLDREYKKYKRYFDKLYNKVDKNIHLDEEQIKVILADENSSLVIAGAGTGKTTTMVAKVKYLVEVKKVDPSKILVMSYTRKATAELQKRIVVDFNLPVEIQTFHSLGYKIIRNIYKEHFPYVVDNYERNQIFYNYIKDNFENKRKIKDFIELFTPQELSQNWVFSSNFKDNYTKYKTYDEYLAAYNDSKIKEAINSNLGIEGIVNSIIDHRINSESPLTIKGEFVKSKGEAIIANFLFTNGINYEYEKVYENILPDYKVYKPDFTLNIGGQEIYLEYFGLSNYKSDQIKTYEKIKRMKENYHRKHHNKFIKIDYLPGEDIEKSLESQLKKMGINLNPINIEAIYKAILSNDKLPEIYRLSYFFYDVIDAMKSSSLRKHSKQVVTNYVNKLSKEDRVRAIKQYNYIMDFLRYYQKQLFSGGAYGFDYSDLIYYAKENFSLLNKNVVNYEYILIDEYQDISFERYELAKKLVNENNSKIMAVGDDWQTIYSFAGSKIEYIYNFSQYFDTAKLFKITKTYRNSQQLLDYAGNFIMRNPDQITKLLNSDKNIEKPIMFVNYNEMEEIETAKKLVNYIHKKNPDHNILILSRYNKTINSLFYDDFFIDDLDTKIKIKGIDDIEVNGMSIHKSKGLTADEVIILGLDKTFPSSERSLFWLIDIFKNKSMHEKIPFAEERRIFYVALTRTKNKVYLLRSNNPNNRSPFIIEMANIIHDIDAI